MYLASGSLTLKSVSVNNNTARGGAGGLGGLAARAARTGKPSSAAMVATAAMVAPPKGVRSMSPAAL